MIALFRKELRVLAPWALLSGFVIIAACLSYITPQPWFGHQAEQYFHGFLFECLLVASIAQALLFGIVHTFPDHRWDQLAFLLQRGVSKRQIFAMRTAAAILCYAVTFGTAILGTTFYLRTIFHESMPFEWAQLRSVSAVCCLNFAFYFAVWSVQFDRRGVVQNLMRLIPTAFPALALWLVQKEVLHDEFVPWPIWVIVFAVNMISALIALNAFSHRVQTSAYSLAGRWSLRLAGFVTMTAVWVLIVMTGWTVLCEYSPEVRSEFHGRRLPQTYTSKAVLKDETVCEYTVEHLDGRTRLVSAHRINQPAQDLSNTLLKPLQSPLSQTKWQEEFEQHFVNPVWLSDRLYQQQYNPQRVLFSMRLNSTQDNRWWYNPQTGSFHGLTVDAEATSSISAGGFNQPNTQSFGRMLPDLDWRDFTSGYNGFRPLKFTAADIDLHLTDRGLFEINHAAQSVRHLFAIEKPLRAVRIFDDKYAAVLLADEVRLYSVKPYQHPAIDKEKNEVTIFMPDQLKHSFPVPPRRDVALTWMERNKKVLLSFSTWPSGLESVVIDAQTNEQQVLAADGYHQELNSTQAMTGICLPAITAVWPKPMATEIAAEMVLSGFHPLSVPVLPSLVEKPMLFWAALAGFTCLWIVFARRIAVICGLSKSHRFRWQIAALLLGPIAVLLLIATTHRPQRIRCEHCKRRRSVDHHRCEFCDAPFTAPTMRGTEILQFPTGFLTGSV